MSDSVVDGRVNSGTQQQWISRNSEWGSWTGANWNMVFVGVPQAPAGRLARASLHQDREDAGHPRETLPRRRCEGQLRRPRSRSRRRTAPALAGTQARHPARPFPLAKFYIAKPGDSADTINSQLAKGNHLLLTPGIYELTKPIEVTEPGTIVMGLGFATLKPINGTAAMTVADVDGVTVAGLLFDAVRLSLRSSSKSGPREARRATRQIRHCSPTSSSASAAQGSAESKVIARHQLQRRHRRSHLDLARGPRHRRRLGEQHRGERHGRRRRRRHRVRPLCRALPAVPGAVEGQQRTNVLLPVRDSLRSAQPDQLHQRSPNLTDGPPTRWPTTSPATRPGAGSLQRLPPSGRRLTRAIEVPSVPGVRFHHMITVALGNLGSIDNVINNTGGRDADEAARHTDGD